MATHKKTSVLGEISGKLGGAVFLNSKGVGIVRSTPETPPQSKISKGQLKERSLFATVQDFVSSMPIDLINIGYQLPRKSKRSHSNEALSYHKNNAVIGKAPDFEIDLTKVKFTKPINLTAGGWNVRLDISIHGLAVVRWELNAFPQKHTQPDDLAHVIFYDENQKRYFLQLPIRRDQLSFSFSEPSKRRPAPERNMHCWIFFSSADEKLISYTEYLGNFIL